MSGEVGDRVESPGGGGEIGGVLADAGWTVMLLIGDALAVQGRTYDVTNVSARRGGLRAWVVVARDCEPGGIADQMLSLHVRPTTAVRRRGDTKVLVDVTDYSCARAELESLLPALRQQEDFYQACVAAATDRGWDITDRTRSASEDWDQSWTIRGTRAGQALHIGLVGCGSGRDEQVRESDGAAVATRGGLYLSVTVHTTTDAEALADTLLAGL
jgi:hypothetical protein